MPGKADVRSRVLAVRAALPAEYRARASAAICDHLATLPGLAPARAVAGYASFGAEVDVDAWLRACLQRELGVFLPRVEGPDLVLTRIDDLDADVAPGWRGVREPRSRRAARPDRIDALVVPGVAFTREGQRLGYGGGHYDRLLAAVRADALVIGVGFAAQLVDDLPLEPHDRPVDVVVTEEGPNPGAAGVPPAPNRWE